MAWHWVDSGDLVDTSLTLWTTSSTNRFKGARSARSDFTIEEKSDSYEANFTDGGHQKLSELKTSIANSSESTTTSIESEIRNNLKESLDNQDESVELDISDPPLKVPRDSIMRISNTGLVNDAVVSGISSPILHALLHPESQAADSQVASSRLISRIRHDPPWSISNGRCLLLHNMMNKDTRTFKYAAEHCGYPQYFVCQHT